MCSLVSDRNTIFLGHCYTSKLSLGPKTKTSFSISVCLRPFNDCFLELRVWPKGHMYLLVNLQKRQSTKHLPEVVTAWAYMELSGLGLLLPGDLECLEGPLLAHYLLFLSKPVRGTLTQNLAGGQFSREGKKGVNRTMAQIVWKKQRENPSGAPCGLDHCDGVNAFYIVLVYIHP